MQLLRYGRPNVLDDLERYVIGDRFGRQLDQRQNLRSISGRIVCLFDVLESFPAAPVDVDLVVIAEVVGGVIIVVSFAKRQIGLRFVHFFLI